MKLLLDLMLIYFNRMHLSSGVKHRICASLPHKFLGAFIKFIDRKHFFLIFAVANATYQHYILCDFFFKLKSDWVVNELKRAIGPKLNFLQHSWHSSHFLNVRKGYIKELSITYWNKKLWLYVCKICFYFHLQW